MSTALGGEELNDDPEQKPHRYVINFAELAEVEARRWPDLMAIVEAKVRPERVKLGNSSSDKPRKERWWLWGRYTPGLYRAIQGKARVLAVARVGQHGVFAWLPVGLIYSEQLVVFPNERDAFFAVLQSFVHEVWARFFSSSLEDRLRYTPSDCFETFPFPQGWETSSALEDIGRRYHEHRAAIMRRTLGTKKPEGLTATYNRFHDANERSGEIATLRALHAEMDRAVLDAYGWTDIRSVYDYRVQLDERVRYTWDDETRDEVLARLLEENRQRAGTSAPTPRRRESEGDEAEEGARTTEADASAVSTSASAVKAKRPRKKKGDDEGTPGLPGVG